MYLLHSPGGFDQINDHNLNLQRARFVLYAARPKHVVLDADISLPSIAILAWHCMHALQLWHGIASIWSLLVCRIRLKLGIGTQSMYP